MRWLVQYRYPDGTEANVGARDTRAEAEAAASWYNERHSSSGYFAEQEGSADGGLPTPTAPSAHELVVVAKALRSSCNRLDLVRERLAKDRIHHGIFGDDGSARRVAAYEAEEEELRLATIALVQEVRAHAVRVRP